MQTVRFQAQRTWPLVGGDGPAVLVTGRVAYRLGRLLLAELRRARDNGEVVDAELVATIRAIEAAGTAYAQKLTSEAAAEGTGTSAPSDAEAPAITGPQPAVGDGEMTATMTTAAVAARLGCSERNVRALADRGALPGRRVGRAWVFDAVEVEEYATARLLVSGL